MRRKAISPVIATLLLIVIAIVAGIAVYGFVTGWIGGTTKSTGSQKGSLALDYAEADASGATGVIKAYVRNVGGVAVKITEAYIESPNGTVEQVTGLAVTIDPQQVALVTINSANAFTVGYVYTVKLVASDGTSLVFSVRAHA